MSDMSQGASYLSSDPFRPYRWQPAEATNPNWVPQFQPATWQRPFVHKRESVSRSSSSDVTVPAWAKVKVLKEGNTSLSGASEREPVSDYKWSSKAALVPPPAAHIPVNRALFPPIVFEPPAAAPVLASLPISAPPAPEKQEDPARRYTMQTERTSVRRASVAARTSREFVPPLPGAEPHETASAEGEEFEIPDFKYTVPHTPRYSSLPQHRTGPSSGLEVAREHSFPPTPPSIAGQYAYLSTAGAHVVVSPMSSMDPQRDGVTSHQAVPKDSETTANVLPRLVKVVGTFKSALDDELVVSLGENLRLLHVFPDDWCLVQRLFPQEPGEHRAMSVMESGAVPILCLAEIGSGEPVPRVPPSAASSPISPASLSHNENSSAPLSKSPAISEGSGVSGTSGQTGATDATNATETTHVSDPRSHWSSATTALESSSPITSPGSDGSGGQVVKAILGDGGPISDTASSPVPSPGSSVASGQSLVVPHGLSGGGYMPRMPKKLSQVPKPVHGRTNSSNKIGMTLRNGGFALMLDRTRAS